MIEYARANESGMPLKVPIPFKQWLTEVVKLPDYLGMFIENGLDEFEVAIDLTDAELKEIGIKMMGHRKRILMGLKKVNYN